MTRIENFEVLMTDDGDISGLRFDDIVVEATEESVATLADHDLDSAVCIPEDADWLEWVRDIVKDCQLPTTPLADAPEAIGGEEITGSIDRDQDEPEVEIAEEVSLPDIGSPVSGAAANPEVKRAGCRKPWEVKGWVEDKVLAVTKNHRNGWGRCEYRVKCLPFGRYQLIYFSGNRNDLVVGTEWDYAQEMFRSFLGHNHKCVGSTGKKQGTRLTIKQFFGGRVRKPKATTGSKEADNE